MVAELIGAEKRSFILFVLNLVDLIKWRFTPLANSIRFLLLPNMNSIISRNDVKLVFLIAD